jgi:hypothetical protein
LRQRRNPTVRTQASGLSYVEILDQPCQARTYASWADGPLRDIRDCRRG